MTLQSGTDWPEKFTFDDVLLLPGYSEVLPSEVDLGTRLARDISLRIPVLSAAMDTVTESEMAIALAQEGGMGVVHKNMSIESQCGHVRRVKRSESGIVVDPVTISVDAVFRDAVVLAERNGVSGFPVVDGDRLVGMLTNRDYQFEEDMDRPVRELMTPVERIVTAPQGTDAKEALLMLREHKLEKLPLVDDEMRVKGLVTAKDVRKAIAYPDACKDSRGSLRVGAAVGVGNEAVERAAALVDVGVDCLFVDTAHGHSSRVIEMVRSLRADYREMAIVAGNVVTPEAVDALADAGADCIKIGVGPGSICTTRVIAGVGCPQISAVIECSRVASARGLCTIADGGIKYSGDIIKALAAGAGAVMIGSLFAGTSESPGETIIYKGRKFKIYRGMGSLGAMREGSADRYFQEGRDPGKLVPEGIEGMVPFKGPLKDYVLQLNGGLRAGMGYVGAANLSELSAKARFVRITSAGLRESHAHDVLITKEAPNYSTETDAF